MPLRTHIPSPPLSDFVEFIWHMTEADSGNHDTPLIVVPHGCSQLVIHLGDSHIAFTDEGRRHRVLSPLLAGPYSRAFEIDTRDYSEVLGARFRAGVARAFFDVSMGDLNNRDAPLEELYPGEGRRLADRLLSASTPRVRIAILESFLTARLNRTGTAPDAVRYAVDQFASAPGERSIAQVQARCGYSHTRFIQLFREAVGVTPKLFCRIQRFRGAMERIQQGRPVNWAVLAADCGYFDQSHLIRDFRAFAGTTPAAYAQVQARSRDSAAGAS